MGFERFRRFLSSRFRLPRHVSHLGYPSSFALTPCVALTLADSSPMLETIIAGFDDYTNDQRGDVGSWVRLASIASVSDFLSTIPLDQLLQDQLLTQERLDRIVASLLKQGVERLDNVRESSGLVLEMIAGTAALYSGEVVLRGQDLFGKMR